MATAATSTRGDLRARSFALASARGETVCSWHARTIGWTLDEVTGELVVAAWRVKSATSDAEYTVTYEARADRAQCACRAARFGAPCWHAGLALMKGRAIAHLYSPSGRAEVEREARSVEVFEENMRAIGL